MSVTMPELKAAFQQEQLNPTTTNEGDELPSLDHVVHTIQHLTLILKKEVEERDQLEKEVNAMRADLQDRVALAKDPNTELYMLCLHRLGKKGIIMPNQFFAFIT